MHPFQISMLEKSKYRRYKVYGNRMVILEKFIASYWTTQIRRNVGKGLSSLKVFVTPEIQLLCTIVRFSP